MALGENSEDISSNQFHLQIYIIGSTYICQHDLSSPLTQFYNSHIFVCFWYELWSSIGLSNTPDIGSLGEYANMQLSSKAKLSHVLTLESCRILAFAVFRYIASQ